MGEEQACNTNQRKVMVAIEESECSRYALKWVLENFRDCLSASSLVIFTVPTPASFAHIYAASYGSARLKRICRGHSTIKGHDQSTRKRHPDLLLSVEENNKMVSLTLLEKAKEICARQGVIAETAIEVGDPKVVICNAVEKLKIDILILGSHGGGPSKGH